MNPTDDDDFGTYLSTHRSILRDEPTRAQLDIFLRWLGQQGIDPERDWSGVTARVLYDLYRDSYAADVFTHIEAIAEKQWGAVNEIE